MKSNKRKKAFIEPGFYLFSHLAAFLLFVQSIFVGPAFPANWVEASDPSVSNFKITRGDGDASYNGNLDFSLPIMTVPGRGGLNYDIILEYTAGGGVSGLDCNSWVGLGWNINPGQISCTPATSTASAHLGGDDMFFLSYPGGGGAIYKFGTTWLPIKWEANEIQVINTGNELDANDKTGFVVTTKDGTRYVFRRCLRRLSEVGLTNHLDVPEYNGITGRWYTYVIKLTAILGPNYKDSNGNLIPEDGTEKDDGNYIKFEYGSIYCAPISGSSERMDVCYLQRIITPTHKAVFTLGGTTDHFLYLVRDAVPYETCMFKYLTSIQLYAHDASEISANIIKEIQFNNPKGFNFFSNNYRGYTINDVRRKLTSIQEFSAGGIATGSALPATKFEYYDYIENGYLDPWNYYTSIGRAQPDVNKVDRWMLKKVTYPSGGWIQFEYEADKYIQFVDKMRNQGVEGPAVGGGVRLYQKIICDQKGNTATYTYSYASNHNGYGFLSGYPAIPDVNNTSIYKSTTGLGYNTDVHYPDVTTTYPDGSKIKKYFTSAATQYTSNYAENSEKVPPTVEHFTNNFLPISEQLRTAEKVFDDNVGSWTSVIPGLDPVENLTYWQQTYFFSLFTNYWKRGICWKEEYFSNTDFINPVKVKKFHYSLIPKGAREYWFQISHPPLVALSLIYILHVVGQVG